MSSGHSIDPAPSPTPRSRGDQPCRCGTICWRVGGTAACGYVLPPEADATPNDPVVMWLHPAWARLVEEFAQQRGFHVYRLPGDDPVYAVGIGPGPTLAGMETHAP